MSTFKERLMQLFFLSTAFISILAVLMICIFLFGVAFPSLWEIGPLKFLTGTVWRPLNNEFGILPMIVGSICVTAGAAVIGLPAGIGAAVFMEFFAGKRIRAVMKPAVDLLAGIPSIVYGFFGLMTLVPLIQYLFGGSGKGILAASVLLGIMILPTITGVAGASLRAVPRDIYNGAAALGASHERCIFLAVLPAARSGVLAALVLGVGRAIGETMAVVMVAGNQAVIPGGILDGVRTMTTNIVLEMGYASGLHRGALIATAAVLFIFILIINMSFSLLRRRNAQ